MRDEELNKAARNGVRMGVRFRGVAEQQANVEREPGDA
jgi:hypothetical protein